MNAHDSKSNQNDKGTAPRQQADGDNSDISETPRAGGPAVGKGSASSPDSDEDEDTDEVDADTDSSVTRNASSDVATHRAEDRHGEKRNTM